VCNNKHLLAFLSWVLRANIRQKMLLTRGYIKSRTSFAINQFVI
jgi:hypothetical protein